MADELTEGKTYTVKATTTNMSTRAGVPVAATLNVNIVAVVNSETILEDSEVYEFAAEQTHTFEFLMTVPLGTGGKAGAVVAEVLDPNENKLDDGRLDVVIVDTTVTQYDITVDAPSQVTTGDFFSVTFQIDIPQSQIGLIHAVDARLMGPEQGISYAILNTGEVGRITLTLSLQAVEWWEGQPLTPGTYDLETRFYRGGAGWSEYIWNWKSMITIQVDPVPRRLKTFMALSSRVFSSLL